MAQAEHTDIRNQTHIEIVGVYVEGVLEFHPFDIMCCLRVCVFLFEVCIIMIVPFGLRQSTAYLITLTIRQQQKIFKKIRSPQYCPKSV